MKKDQLDQFHRMLSLDARAQAVSSRIRAYFSLLQQSNSFDELSDFITRLGCVCDDFIEEYSSSLE